MSKPRKFSIFVDPVFQLKHNSYRCIEIADEPIEGSALQVIDKAAYDKAVEALKFYAQAKTLFLATTNETPRALDSKLGVMAGFHETETHIKDDGIRARKTLEELGDL